AGRRGELADHERELWDCGEPLRRLRRHLPVKIGRSWEFKKTRRRLQRTPPRPGCHRVTRAWFSAPLYGRCLLVEANLCVNCRWSPDGERTPSSLRRSEDNVKRVLHWPAYPVEV